MKKNRQLYKGLIPYYTSPYHKRIALAIEYKMGQLQGGINVHGRK